MPSKDEIAEAFSEAALEVLGELPPGLTGESSIAADVGADSLDMLEIVLVLEERFDLTVEEDDFEEVVTIQDALDRLFLVLNASPAEKAEAKADKAAALKAKAESEKAASLKATEDDPAAAAAAGAHPGDTDQDDA